MGKKNFIKVNILHCAATVLLFLLFPLSNLLFAQESTCARVKIEIKQELTLERQGFDAHMRINNGLTHTSLEDIQVDVWFTNEAGEPVLASSDPDDLNALFFIRLAEMSNIDDVSGSGSVPADASSDIHWLIIPATGASNGLSSGTLYNVGATLTYTIGGEENVIEVDPDYIFVKPMPELTLDYFLPYDIYGDDPFTSEIEPSIPFSLGVRVKNSGSGDAHNLKIDSAQPKIVDNDQGLLINFNIQGSQVNNEGSIDSLLLNFGTIESGTSAMGRWFMNCSLSGRFVDFEAKFSHADELGGELTSLIEAVNTHTLVQEVLVDLPGKDSIYDFLSRSDDLYRVFESDSLETDVTNQSALSSLVFKENIGDESYYTLSVPVTTGFMFAKLADPHIGSKILKGATRSDGKQIKEENVWLSKTQDRETHQWDHFVNLFDVNTTNEYTLVFDAASSVPGKPVLQFIDDKHVRETQQVSFIVESSDPNGTTPSLVAAPLPVGADFIDSENGTGIFDWTPQTGQKGIYYISFTADDGGLTQSQRVKFTVYDINDTDMDGMLDDWEISNFSDLQQDGTGDFDSDGISDLQEFIDQTDPTLDESAPTTPDPLYPYPNVDVTDPEPELVIENSSDPQDDPIDYEFEIYSDPQMTDMVASQGAVARMFKKTDLFIYNWVAADGDLPVPTSESTTNWQVPVVLPDNTRYYWRVRSSDEEGASLWAYQDFFVNTQNDPPSSFQISSPENESDVDTLTPQLTIMNSRDIDNDVITYVFEVYEDEEMTIPVTTSGPVPQGTNAVTSWNVNTELLDNAGYFWRAMAFDGNGGEISTTLQSFYVNTANQAPETPLIASPTGQSDIETPQCLLVVENASDANNDPLTYLFEIDTSPTFDSSGKQVSEFIMEGAETTSWQVAGLLENTTYYWRVKANDSAANSSWAQSDFFVNSMNEAPSMPTIKNPGNKAWVDTRNPVLSVHPATDPDQDRIEYRFEVYSNQALTRFVVQADSQNPDWTIPTNLKNNTRYFWRAQAIDEHGVPGPWTETSEVFIKIDIVNQTPEIAIIAPNEDLNTNINAIEIQWEDSDQDSSALISLYYDTDSEGEDGILIISDIEEDLDDDQDSFTWDISTLEDGQYYLYAVISDEDTEVVHYAPVSVTIDRTPPALSVNPAGGEYEDIQMVSITTDEPSQIRFTLDGSDPDLNSPIYSSPLEVSETVTLKCMGQDLAGNISGILTQEYTFNIDAVTLNLTTDKGQALSNVNVYVFNESGSYYGRSARTDSEGNALFDPDLFSPAVYKFRVDYLGNQFWTDLVQLPDDMFTKFIIPVETINLTVTTTNTSAAGFRVYLFSESGAYLGQNQTTDENGLVSFELPVGVKYKFRADVLGSQYWTEAASVQGGGINNIGLNAGGGLLTLSLKKDEQTPISGIRMYLFSPAGSYLGRYQTTDENGLAAFEVPGAAYKVRADYTGYQFWSDVTSVVTDTLVNMTLPHQDIQITVSGRYNNAFDPIEGVKTYLFSPSNSYLGKDKTTDESGYVEFSLPDKAYKVRVDYLGQQFWSQEFIGQDTPVDIPMAKAQVTVSGSGLPQSGIKVYLFSETGAYLGQYLTTDADGLVFFTIPEGRYKFRADYEGSQFWSPISSLAADMENPVEVSVGGGRFTFMAQKDSGQSISGVKCYVFTENKSYIGLYGATDENGEAFFDLADGTYLFRFDYMGTQFWSDPVVVPDQLAYQMNLAHETAQVNVFTKNDPVKNAKVYLFSATDSYLVNYKVTDDNGIASFDLPVGIDFRFRADILGTHHWSDTSQISDGGVNQINLDAGGGQFSIILQKDGLTPLPQVKVYLFNENGSYAGIYKTTDEQGNALFEVPQASWKIRADYKGYQFWTDPAVISDDTQINWTIPHGTAQVHVTLSWAAASNIKVYMFNAAGTYLGQYVATDENGIAQFLVPSDVSYKFRVDINSQQVWSQTVDVQADQANTIEVEIQ